MEDEKKSTVTVSEDVLDSLIKDKIKQGVMDEKAKYEKEKAQLEEDKVKLEVEKAAITKEHKNDNPFTDRVVTDINDRRKFYPAARFAIAKAIADEQKIHVVDVFAKWEKENPNDVANQFALASQCRAMESRGIPSNSLVDRAKAVGIGSITTGGGFLDSSVDDEFIELLTAQSVLRRIGTPVKQMINGQLKMNRGLTASSIVWLGSNTTITESSPTYDQLVMTAHKFGALVYLDNDWLRFNAFGAEAEVQSQLIEAAALAEDTAFLSGNAAANQPIGMTNTNGINTATMTGTPTAITKTQDLLGLGKLIAEDNGRVNNMWYIMNPTHAYELAATMDSTGQPVSWATTLLSSPNRGQTPFDAAPLLGGRLATTTNLATGTIILVDIASLVIAEGYGLLVESDTSNRFENDQTTVRAIGAVDLGVRHVTDIATLTGISGW